MSKRKKASLGTVGAIGLCLFALLLFYSPALYSQVVTLPSAGGATGPTGPTGATGATGPSAGIVVATVTLTAAQIATLQSAPFVLVASPGLGAFLVPENISLSWVGGTIPFNAGLGDMKILQGATALVFANGAAGGNMKGEAAIDSSFVSSLDPVAMWTLLAWPDGTSQLLPTALLVDLPLLLQTDQDNAAGIPLTTSISAPGLGYVAGDTVQDADGTLLATVNTVGALGVVVTYTVTNVGTTQYPVNGTLDMGSNVAPQAGIGTGFALNVDSVTLVADGSLRVTVQYRVHTIQ